ncbi:MAG: glycosyltransferase family 4 protein [Thiotrichaceae bacterium]|nr:glycosyltransferase family 4 protein [Thiotrichaceae bacterium]
MDSIKILQLTTAFVVGGAEKVILELCTHLSPPFETQVIALSHNDDMLPEFIQQGVKAKKLDMKKGIFSFFHTFSQLNKVIKEEQIDILHAHLFHPLPFAILLKIANPRLKIVFTSHNTDIGGRFREAFTYLTKKYRNKDIIFSEDMCSSMYRDDAEIIANGVDIDKLSQPLKRYDKFTFISVGTIREQKNQIYLLRCATHLKEAGYEFDIHIVGGGDENTDLIEKIEQEIEENQLSECVHMLGNRTDIPALLLQSHCMVLPSLFEGMPLVLLEAGAAKLPILATPVGAIPSLLESTMGVTAPLDQFYTQMKWEMDNQEIAQRYAELFAQKIEHSFSIKAVVKSHEQLYNEVLEPTLVITETSKT